MNTSVARTSHDIPLPIYLQEILRWPDREIRGRAITKFLAAILASRFPKGEARMNFEAEIERQAAQLDAVLLTAALTTPALATALDEIIIQQAALTGQPITDSSLVAGRLAVWRKQNVILCETFQKAVLLGDKRSRGDRPFPLNDPLLPSFVRTFTDELRAARRLLSSFQATRRGLSHEQMLERLRQVVTSGACQHLAGNWQKWSEFFSHGKHRQQLRALVENKGRLELRPIVCAYLGHFTGHTANYIDRTLRPRQQSQYQKSA